MKLENIDAILFDSEKVLNGPKTGHWFISPNFFSFANKLTFENISIENRNKAFSMAGNYINSIAFINTKEEEYEHFKKYYEIFSKELPELQLDIENINELAKDLVFNTEKYKFFDDAVKVIPFLHKKYKLAVVSDTWPSLKDVFINTGLYSYFSSELQIDNYGTKIVDISNKDVVNYIYITFGITPMIGAHNPVGYDEAVYKVNSRGDITLEQFNHLKSFDIPERYHNYITNPLPKSN